MPSTPSGQIPQRRKKAWYRPNRGVAAVIVLVVIVVAWAFLTQPSSVRLIGRVVIVGSNTTPLTVNFQRTNSVDPNFAFNFTVTSLPTGGFSYSGSVRNHQSYTITIGWRDSLGDTGTCPVGTLPIDANVFSIQPITLDVACIHISSP